MSPTFSITPDGTGVVYLADQETDGVNELFTTFDRQIVYLSLVLLYAPAVTQISDYETAW
jgi:hypothetical protein